MVGRPAIAFTELSRGQAHKIFKGPGKIALVVVADTEADFGTVFVCRKEEAFGMADSDLGKVIDYCNTHLFLEEMGKPRDTEMSGFCDVSKGNGSVEVGIDKFGGGFYLGHFVGILRGIDALNKVIQGIAYPGT